MPAQVSLDVDHYRCLGPHACCCTGQPARLVQSPRHIGSSGVDSISDPSVFSYLQLSTQHSPTWKYLSSLHPLSPRGPPSPLTYHCHDLMQPHPYPCLPLPWVVALGPQWTSVPPPMPVSDSPSAYPSPSQCHAEQSDSLQGTHCQHSPWLCLPLKS